MRKWLAIFGLVVLTGGAWSQVPGDGSKQHNYAQDKQKTANPSNPVVEVDSQHGANNQEQASEKPAKYPWGELLAPANIPNWFLVVVGGITGWFVYKTLRAIKKQADIMETQAKDAREAGVEATRIALATAQAARDSAKAASDQIDMMRDKEEALLQVIPIKLEKLAPYVANKIALEALNVGATVALEVSIKAGARISAKGLNPEEGEYLNLDIPILLKPFEPKQSSVECYIPRKRGGQLWDADAQITIDVRGEFRYRDVFNAVHTNFFSFRMNADGFDILPDGSMALKVSRHWYPRSDDAPMEF